MVVVSKSMESELDAFAQELERSLQRKPTRADTQDKPDRLSALPPDLLRRVLACLPHSALRPNGALSHVSQSLRSASAAEARSRVRNGLLRALVAGFEADDAAHANESSQEMDAATSSDEPSLADATAVSGATSPAPLAPSSDAPPAVSHRASGSDDGLLSTTTSSSSSCGGSSGNGGCSLDGRAAWAHEPMPLTEIADTLEQELHRSSVPFNALYRKLLFNLKDPKNPQLRTRLVRRELEPTALLSMSSHEMASSALQRQRSEWREEGKRRCISPGTYRITTSLYRCERCGCHETYVHQTIRAGRRHVDRTRTYATCLQCADRWEI